MNRLADEKSAYLRHAASQKIDWFPWCDEAFEKARTEDKPVFLSSGAVWCHWCHVMAKESFHDDEVVVLLNDNFISIKLDRDERPDIDKRYQKAVSAMSGGGGWPLSIFLTPDKKPFFGGTYFPPEDSHGRPGFRKVLREVSGFYKSQKSEIAEYTERLINFLKPEPSPHTLMAESLIEEAVSLILSEHDPQHGGFGTSPKFPMPGAMEFLISRYAITRSEAVGSVVRKTLEAMAKGGFHDQLLGGFHRYSTDEAWIIPHFEKMADDNAWLLRHYCDAYSIFDDAYFREVAEGIVTFMKEVLSDPAGGFYASQDADVSPDDEGGYFTWTDEEFRTMLTEEEYRVLSLHLLDERGTMHHDESKKVLFMVGETDQIVGDTGLRREDIPGIIKRGKQKLLAERKTRKAPFIDSSLYTSLNGMLISASLHAFRSLKDPWLKDFSLKSLDVIMKKYFAGNQLFHSEGIKGVLDDYIYIDDALISAYEVTADRAYLAQADSLMELCIEKLWDREEGGFFDAEDAVLGIRLKGIEDVPHPSANSLAMILLLKLHYMTGKNAYYGYAEKALKAFAGQSRDMGIHAGYYAAALDAYYNMIKITLETSYQSTLTETALFYFSPYTCIVYAEDRGQAIPCIRGVCLEPITSPDSLKTFLRQRS